MASIMRIVALPHSETAPHPSRLEQAFTVLSLFVFSRALVFHIFAKNPGERLPGGDLVAGGTNVINQPQLLWIYLGIYCVTGLLVLRRWREVLHFFYQEKFLLLLLILSALSSLWSVAPMETLAKTVAISACTVFGCYFALSYEPARQLHLLAWALYLVILASFATVLFFPELGIMQDEHEGLWRGAFTHKNLLGKIAPLGTITLFLAAASSSKYRGFYWAGFGLSLALLLMSCSKSALLLICMTFFTGAIYLAFRKQYKLAAIALLSVGIAAGSFYLQYSLKVFPPIVFSEITSNTLDRFVSHEVGSPASSCAGLLEKYSSLAPESAEFSTGEGRISLWRLLGEKVREQPLLGYGFGGFWLGMDGPSSDIWNLKRWGPSHAHNGFLDIWLHLGLVGIALFVMSFCAAVYWALPPLFSGPVEMAKLLPPALLFYVLLANIGESDLFATNSILWICFVTAAISARKYLHSPGVK